MNQTIMLGALLASGAALTTACIDDTDLDSHGVGDAEVRVCASGPTLAGIDVSYYQSQVNWAAVAAAGIDFAFIRVSDGLNFPDSQFQRNWSLARANGIVRGAYQFFRPNQDPIAQADMLLDAMGPLGPDDLPPVIDIEATGGLSAAAIVERAGRWIDRVEAATGKKPIIYTGKYFWQDNVGASSAFLDHPLWVPQYGRTCPDTPTPWPTWAFWQYSDRGSVSGVAGGVDVNVFNGDLDDLLTLAGGAPRLPMGVRWERQASGTYELRADAPAEVVRVEYRVDGHLIGEGHRAQGADFADRYAFTSETSERELEATGFDAQGAAVARGIGLLDVTAGVGVYIRQTGEGEYEIGLERAPAGVAAIEVRAGAYRLTDSVTGQPRSSRNAVRSTFMTLGRRDFAIDTYNADGTRRGTLRRSFVLR